MNLVVIILTYNESRHVTRAMASVAEIASQVLVVDSGSTDDTVRVAESHGATVLYHPFVNQAKQFQWALDNAPISADWIFRLDADEIIEPDLADEIRRRLPVLAADVTGIVLKRKHIFMGRWVRRGGRYPLLMLRIFRRGKGHIEDRWMDEHIVVTEGRTVTFNGGFIDHNLNDLTYFVDKHNKYATREAIEALNQELGLFGRDEALSSESASWQAAFKRWGKERVYNRIPFTVSAPLYFLWRYIFQLGFLDGREGLVYHFLQGYWYRFLVGARKMELQRAIAHLSDKHEICAELSRLTGLKLVAGTD
ncbi:glycosyltransferase family 2 protein [Pseudoxanthomonas spadix]|uniref:glycosyltransferase family 2 protein n=1 Tax=Pseudoxanthomonas spadix TaxID=415229 RepID=UPI000F00E824|nr:glycosyltransferase family 2 protein [Pseudoxanthomonas spadix]MBP3973298.1 glycosyltransferase family 2 protein [Pseudoxanthomonas spadix]RMW96544.1 glycosyltransferase family 2 protein [Pseudoxanthomonas spadix]